jgi:hypothetical protein
VGAMTFGGGNGNTRGDIGEGYRRYRFERNGLTCVKKALKTRIVANAGISKSESDSIGGKKALIDN